MIDLKRFIDAEQRQRNKTKTKNKMVEQKLFYFTSQLLLYMSFVFKRACVRVCKREREKESVSVIEREILIIIMMMMRCDDEFCVADFR